MILLSIIPILFLLLTLTITSSHFNDIRRELYDFGRYQDDNRLINVSTANQGLKYPVGATLGLYKNNKGLFVSTYNMNNIYFMDLGSHHCINRHCDVVQVAGTGTAGTSDGTFDTASFTCPSRMLYLDSHDLLLVTDRANGYIRMLNFKLSTVKSMMAPRYYNRYSKADGYKIARLRVSGSQLPSDHPEIDIKSYGNYIYVSDSGSIYNITGHNGTLDTLYNLTQVNTYTTLTQWQRLHSYDKSSHKVYISSFAIRHDTNNPLMYISLSYQRNAIISMPLNCHNYNEIKLIVSDGLMWDKIPIVYPIPKNGCIHKSTSNASVPFPMSLHYNKKEDTLYWTEVYATSSQGTKNGAMGSVAVRRLKFSTKIVDYFAGNVGSFRAYLGKVTGYEDGPANIAQFSYPVTLVGNDDLVSDDGGPLLYIADYQNQAIRVVYSHIDSFPPTSSPTFTPTVSLAPTLIPTESPTSTEIPSVSPTTLIPGGLYQPHYSYARIPSALPSTSRFHACLKISLIDQFGDGWSGAVLKVIQPNPIANSEIEKSPDISATVESTYTSSCFVNPTLVSVCASRLAKDMQYGTYTLQITYPEGTPNLWEILWRVKGSRDNRIYSGVFDTSMTFHFDDDGFALTESEHMLKLPLQCDVCRTPSPTGQPVLNRDVDSSNVRSRMRHVGGLDVTHVKSPNADIHHVIPRGHIIRPDGHSSLHFNTSYLLPIHLFDSFGLGWFNDEGTGTLYYISNADRSQLVASGSICGNVYSMDCLVSLSNGQYYLRVGGAEDVHRTDLSWSFCGVVGTAQEELSFTISGGRCVNGMVRSVETIINKVARTVIMMEGQIILTNVVSEQFSLSEQQTIEQALAHVFNIPQSTRAAILEICETQEGEFCNQYYYEENQMSASADNFIFDHSSSSRVHYDGSNDNYNFSVYDMIYPRNRHSRHLTEYFSSISQRFPETKKLLTSIYKSFLSTTNILSNALRKGSFSSDRKTADVNSIHQVDGRRLKGAANSFYGIRFTVSMVAEEYGIDGTLLYDVLDFTDTVEDLVSTAVLNGQLQSELRSIASMSNTPGLMYAVTDDAIELTVTSISYVSTLPPTSEPSQSPSLQNYRAVSGDSKENKSYDEQSDSSGGSRSYALHKELVVLAASSMCMLAICVMVIFARAMFCKPVDRFNVKKPKSRITELMSWGVDMDDSGTIARRALSTYRNTGNTQVNPTAIQAPIWISNRELRSSKDSNGSNTNTNHTSTRGKKDDFLVLATSRPDLLVSPKRLML